MCLNCPTCGAVVDVNAIICPQCKANLHVGSAIPEQREGRSSVNVAPPLALDRIGLNQNPEEVRYLEECETKNIVVENTPLHVVEHLEFSKKRYKQLSRNWIKRTAFIVLAVILVIIGVCQYFDKSDSGQLILARSFRAKSPQAYWIVGEEFLQAGDIVSAIRAFTLADSKDPANADGLLLLASAYEASNLNKQAEGIYKRIIKDISPARDETYRALTRMLTAQNRMPEVADVLRLAYENTGLSAFHEQLLELLPSSPAVSLPGGRYNSEKTVELTSPEGYEIYYLMDDGTGKLPEEGILYDGKPIKIPEGAVNLRAVAKSLNMVSEPTTVKYILIYPSPAAPKISLAPGTYSKRIPITLRNADKEEKDVIIQYTIDGSIPTENSPIFDGTPIEVPSGRVTIRAFSKNNRGKTSSNQIVGYKFDVKPYPEKMYGEEDVFNGISVYETTLDTFFTQFGRSEDLEDSTYGMLETQSKIFTYDWGTVEFVLISNKWVVAKLDMKQNLTQAPRGIGFGKTEAEITAAFKDMGQKPNLDNTRGLYYDLPNSGVIDVTEKGERFVKYTAGTSKGVTWVLEYYFNSSGEVNRIVHYYQ